MSPERKTEKLPQQAPRPARKPACRVYCLVCRSEQIGPTVAQLKAAGVAERDITVLLRKDCAPAAGGAPLSVDADDRLPPPWWSQSPLALLWWPILLWAPLLPARADR